MLDQNDDETYSLIFGALKHPIRRKILRMLSEEELSYTQMLAELDLDTGHLNYYLESLGELLTKTDGGKYRLSEAGKAALRLMNGVEEPKADKGAGKTQNPKQGLTKWLILVPVIALLASGLILMSVSYGSDYFFTASGSLDIDDAKIVQPNSNVTSIDLINFREFPSNTLTTNYQTFLQIDVKYANVSLQIQVREQIYPEGKMSGAKQENYFQAPTLIYNETWNGPLKPEDGTTLAYTIRIPIKSPQAKGMSVANSFSRYTTTFTNLGANEVVNASNGYRMVASPNYTGSLCLRVAYPSIERTDYQYFYQGIAFITMAIISVVLSLLLTVKRAQKSPPLNRLTKNSEG